VHHASAGKSSSPKQIENIARKKLTDIRFDGKVAWTSAKECSSTRLGEIQRRFKMNARKAAVGLSLLCAILFSAFAASSAMATPGTTAHTCTEKGTATVGAKLWEDEHCIKENALGKWKHVEIPANTPTEVTGTCKKTGPKTEDPSPCATLRGTAFLTKTILTASEVHSTGTLTNEAGPPMKASGTSTIRYTGVKVSKPEKCSVKGEEVKAEANVRTATNATEMWVEAEGKGAEELFASITLEGAECPLKGSVLRVRGKAIGTPNGATLEFKEKEPKNTLRVGGEKENTSEFIGIETLRMTKKEGEKSVTEDPISLTTTTS
jgi:hypothetical protein